MITTPDGAQVRRPGRRWPGRPAIRCAPTTRTRATRTCCRPADAMIVCPATVNTVNKWAAGITDTLALGLLVEGQGRGVPIVAVPFTNAAMAAHPAFREPVARLREWGVHGALRRRRRAAAPARHGRAAPARLPVGRRRVAALPRPVRGPPRPPRPGRPGVGPWPATSRAGKLAGREHNRVPADRRRRGRRAGPALSAGLGRGVGPGRAGARRARRPGPPGAAAWSTACPRRSPRRSPPAPT